MRTFHGMAIVAMLCAGMTCALAQPVDKVKGSSTFTRYRPLPNASGAPATYNAVVTAGVNAHGTIDSDHVSGVKATYTTPPGTLTTYTVSTRTVSALGICPPPFPVCVASGSTKTTAIGDPQGWGLRVGAKDEFAWALVPGPHTGASTWYVGDAWDPWPLGIDGLSPIDPDEPLWDFGFDLDDETDVQIRADGWFSARFTSLVADEIATSQVDAFRAANPELIYDVQFGAIGLNYWVDITYGSPAGFPITFVDSEAIAEAALLQALQSGWTGDLSVLQGTIDVRGHERVTFGTHDHVQAAVPEPASLVVLGLGAFMLARRKKGQR